MKRPSPYFALSAGIGIISFAAILIRHAEAPGTITVFYRLLIGTATLTIPFLLHVGRGGRRLPSKGVWLAALGGFFFAMNVCFWATGIVAGGAAIPTLLVNTAPLWVGLGAMILFRQRLSGLFWVGLLVAVSGCVAMVGRDLAAASAVGRGALLGAVAGVFYAGYQLVSQKGREHLHTLVYLWISSFTATVTLFGVGVILDLPFTGYTPATYANFAVQGVVVQVVAWFLVNYAQGYIPAAIVAPSLLGQPVATAVIAWVLLGEALTAWQIAGGSVILVGIHVVHRSRRRG